MVESSQNSSQKAIKIAGKLKGFFSISLKATLWGDAYISLIHIHTQK